MVFAIIARITAAWISSRKLTSLLVTRVTIPAPDQLPRSDTGTGSNAHDRRTCRNFRQLPNASGTSDGISPTTCGGQLPEDLPTLWQRARCLLWVSVGVASIERAVHRRRFLDLSGEDPGRQRRHTLTQARFGNDQNCYWVNTSSFGCNSLKTRFAIAYKRHRQA